MYSFDDLAFFYYHQTGGFPLGYDIKRAFNSRFNENSVPEIYVWRTRGDNRVSDEHAANNGKTFTRDNPPPTGHPGQAYGCRCVAEPLSNISGHPIVSLVQAVMHTALIELLSEVAQWEDPQMIAHYYIGKGRPKTLQEIGRTEDIKHYYETNYLPRFLKQIHDKARNAPLGQLEDSFENTYEFRDHFYSLGKARITGAFLGDIVLDSNDRKRVVGTGGFAFYDLFRDPTDLHQIIIANILKPIIKQFYGLEVREEDTPKWFKDLLEPGGMPFELKGEWITDIDFLL